MFERLADTFIQQSRSGNLQTIQRFFLRQMIF